MKSIFVIFMTGLLLTACIGQEESKIVNIQESIVEQPAREEEPVVEVQPASKEEKEVVPEVIYGEEKDGAKYFKVYAEKDRVFKINDFVNPDLIVKVGDLVRVDFKSNLEGDSCDFVIDGLGVKSNTISGSAITGVDFVTEERGVYEYSCSTKNFAEKGMKGRFIVE